MRQTGIEFADSSWNPIRGCKWKSDGCTNCWAERIAGHYSIKQEKKSKDEDRRFGPRPGIMSRIAEIDDKGQPRWNGNVQWVGKKFWDPLDWEEEKESLRIVVCSMSDLFYPKISYTWRDDIFGLFSLCGNQTFMVQTKYAAEMRQYFAEPGVFKRIEKSARLSHMEYYGKPHPSKGHLKEITDNVWLGVSVENQATADERIPILQSIPAPLRYIDASPLLGELTLDKYLGAGDVDWVITAGESGMYGRPCDPAWIRKLKQECNEHRVSFFFHRWGAWMPIDSEQLRERGGENVKDLYIWPSGEMSVNLNRSDMVSMKKTMEEYGALIDGEDWKQVPEF